MKRILVVFLSMFLICIFSIPAYTQIQYETARDLYQVWSAGDCFPDYVCGVWTSGGKNNLTIAVQYTDEGKKGIEDIKEMVKDDSTLNFVYKKHSFNYLKSVQEELNKLFKTSETHGLISTAISEKRNAIEVGFLKEYEGREATEKMIAELTEKYGDIIIITYTDPPFEEDLPIYGGVTGSDFSNGSNNNTSILYATLIVSILLTLIYVFLYRNHTHILQTTSGKLVTTSRPLTEKEVVNLVKNSDVGYPKGLDKKILSSIENE